ncbi:ATP-dependent DNA helicase [Listeria aquatica]|uniref:ATP-dependent DNA helicase n=1 Tax=Listeria aquatica TaxID=1494960 RepID=A0A841ZQE5_9LIST|nr:helicase C-terminal domain-containing protein [Listeria aquatica]MBC1521662.1 ATP-dependent DNA helicase [Listeria aquatica]
MAEVRISVRHLVEFVKKSGSIDSRMGEPDRAVLGTKIHKKLQKEAGEGYESEVPLAFECEEKGIQFCIHGRADGIVDGELIDEIKTTHVATIDFEGEGAEVHWAQVILYGYFYAVQEKKESIRLRLTYFHLEEEAISRFERTMTLAEMEQFFKELIEEFAEFAKLMHDFREERRETIKHIDFPYPDYRKGQRELSIAVYRTIAAKEKLFCEAPTGIGKTISTLFPAIKAIGEEKTEKIFYLTAKTATRQVAEDAVQELKRQKMRLKSTTITAKDKICFLTERRCNPEDCEFARGYFDRINLALFDLLKHEDTLSREVIEVYARKHTVCPFELSLDAALFSDLIICDYNYVFDPTVYLRRFFADTNGRYTFLIDEAHNLVDRAKEMYSAALSKRQVLDVLRKVPKQDKKLHRALDQLNKKMLEISKEVTSETGEWVQKEALKSFNEKVYAFQEVAQEWLGKEISTDTHQAVLELFFEARSYGKIAEFYDEHYQTLVEAKKDTQIKQLCLDPSKLLAERMELGTGSILFSATFSPLDYYTKLLGGETDTSRLSFPSPFRMEHLQVLTLSYIDTRFKGRASSYASIAETLFKMVEAKRGNYLFFFPSYAYMDEVYRRFSDAHPDVETRIQEPNMPEEARTEFVEAFQEGHAVAGFAILGGAFSEGVDLKGTRLIGAAIVSVGLAQPNRALDLVKAHFDEREAASGYRYAYQIPGMNKVLQAAGRVIRGEQDRGIVLLIDQRFNEPRYVSEFPRHWQNWKSVSSPKVLDRELARFWNFAYTLGDGFSGEEQAEKND